MLEPGDAGTLNPMLRNLGAVFVGCLFAGMIIMIVEMIGHAIFPPPQEIREALQSEDTTIREEAIRNYIPNAQVGALLFVPLAWAMGTMIGGWVAARLAHPGAEDVAYGVGALMLLVGLLMLVSIPHPLWMMAGVVAFPTGAWLGSRLGRRPRKHL